MAKKGEVLDGRYEILALVGKGDFSQTWLALDKRLNKPWAIKEFEKRVSDSVLAECDLMNMLNHSGIPHIVDKLERENSIYIVMDYIEGDVLTNLLKSGPQSEESVMEWAKQLCDILAYLHRQTPPIIYRDMKPANIMLTPEGEIKLIDFGIARQYKEGKLADTMVLGTPGYASPEHMGSRQTDARSDIFTLGMTMHHLITGVDPRPADYRYAPIRQWNSKLSKSMEAIIDKCTAVRPEDRYQNCKELRYDLEQEIVKRKKGKKVSFFR
ncbi:MAG: serine/threonine protein kinase [Lachnospiraceae bacterium]|nr:serine/threonine protein kinase [Lachnospiraceae bacterium]